MSVMARIVSVAFLCYAFPYPPITRFRPNILSGMREHRANALRVYNQDAVPFSVTYTFGASAAPVRLVQHQHARLLANAGNHI